jgi:hypothetical protein
VLWGWNWIFTSILCTRNSCFKRLKKYRLLCIRDHEINLAPIPVTVVGRDSYITPVLRKSEFRLSKNDELNGSLIRYGIPYIGSRFIKRQKVKRNYDLQPSWIMPSRLIINPNLGKRRFLRKFTITPIPRTHIHSKISTVTR